MKPPPPLNYIRSFECSARHLSFTEAARELGYTQAAVSTHVRALEHYIGRRLFIRFPRSLRLTEMGEAFLPTLRQSLEQIDYATEAILASARKSTVVISCPVSLAENWLAPCMAAFSKKHPAIEIVLHAAIWEEPGEPLADIILSARRDDNPPSNSTMLWEEEVVLLCSPQLLTGPGAIKAPADLLNVNCIGVHGRQEFWQAMSTALGLERLTHDKQLTTNSTNVALELAVTGAGCVAVPLSLGRVYLKRGLLVEPFEIRPPSPWNYYLFEGQVSKGSVVKTVREWILGWTKKGSG
jgi:LysR family transcriptional regulator, glycine cleavage system transcriptional activator